MVVLAYFQHVFSAVCANVDVESRSQRDVILAGCLHRTTKRLYTTLESCRLIRQRVT